MPAAVAQQTRALLEAASARRGLPQFQSFRACGNSQHRSFSRLRRQRTLIRTESGGRSTRIDASSTNAGQARDALNLHDASKRRATPQQGASSSRQARKIQIGRAVLGAILMVFSILLPSRRASAADFGAILAGPLFEPIRQDSPSWLRVLVWNDFKLAVIFLVIAPLVLWIWSLVQQTGREDAIKRIMFGYWQAASLLMWTVYLQIAAQPISFATAALVQVMIPITLWWWKDLSEEVAADQSLLARAFKAWRWIATALATSGAVTQLSQTQAACTLLPNPSAVLNSPLCAAWLEPPFGYQSIFHAGLAAEQLQIVGWIGVSIFAVSLISYLAFSLPRCGRRARSNESLSYKALAKMGFYKS